MLFYICIIIDYGIIIIIDIIQFILLHVKYIDKNAYFYFIIKYNVCVCVKRSTANSITLVVLKFGTWVISQVIKSMHHEAKVLNFAF